MPVKVLNAAGTGTYQWIADGIYYAVDNGADIINLSLGGAFPSDTLGNATEYAYNNGVLVIAASGNDNGPVAYPAAYDDFVSATQYDETRAPYSNYGTSLDLVAPGGNTGVDLNSDGYADGVLQNTFSDTPVDWAYWFWQGTSMATPHVSGVAALLLALDSSLTPTQVRHALESTAEDKGDFGRDNVYGWGLIDAKAALLSIAEPHLLLSVSPSQMSYAAGQSITLGVTVFNELNPPLDSTLTLTISGPNNYYYYETQTVNVAANTVEEYKFNWSIPYVAGTYVLEVGLVPAQLKAYDSRWIEAK